MGDAVTESIDDERRRGLSRRGALKAGVAVGVGVAAWSGASITSFGGTPAYAVSCTGVIPPVDISAGCRNTTQASAPFSYQALSPAGLPAGYTFTSVPNNTPCASNHLGTFTFPGGQTCTVQFRFYDSGCPNGTFRGSKTFGPATSPLAISYSCPDLDTIPPGTVWSNTQYTITAFCYTGSDPPNPECY